MCFFSRGKCVSSISAIASLKGGAVYCPTTDVSTVKRLTKKGSVNAGRMKEGEMEFDVSTFSFSFVFSFLWSVGQPQPKTSGEMWET